MTAGLESRQLRAVMARGEARRKTREPDTLSGAQYAAAVAFADELVRIGKQPDDTRGLMLRAVATHLNANGQCYTARLVQWAADAYEGKR